MKSLINNSLSIFKNAFRNIANTIDQPDYREIIREPKSDKKNLDNDWEKVNKDFRNMFY